jgi:hypothetical protein
MSGVEIRKMTNRTRGFYALMGQYLSRREIAAEIGGTVWDDDDKTWFVATIGGKVAGFCAARPAAKGRTAYLSAYVLPGHRRAGVYRALWQERRAEFPGPAQATCTAASLPLFLAHGWRAVGARGSYTRVEVS